MAYQPQSLVESRVEKNNQALSRERYHRLHNQLGPGRFNYAGDWNSPRVPAAGYTGLALATSISRVHISRVLRGLVGVSLDVLNRIGEATGVGLEDLNWYIGENRKRNVKVEKVKSRLRKPVKPHTKSKPKPRRR